MKNQSSANYQSLQELSGACAPEDRKHKDDVSSLSSSLSPAIENYNDNLYHQKSFFMWSREEFTKEDFITYFYAPSNIYYECSLNSNRAQKEVYDFLKSKNIDIEQGHNILEDIANLAAFHRDFLEHFSHNNSVFDVGSRDDSSEDSDSSGTEDIEGCKELDSPDHDSNHRDSDLDIDIKIIELSKPYQGIEE